jgi:hypothetical protein
MRLKLIYTEEIGLPFGMLNAISFMKPLPEEHIW